MPGDCWDAVCALCSPQETCPTDPSVGEDQGETGLPNRLAFAMCCNSSELLADRMSANALLCRRLCFCGYEGGVVFAICSRA